MAARREFQREAKLRVLLRRDLGILELAKELVRGVVRETQAHVGEVLVENRSAEKTGHLLFFDGAAGRREDVAAPGEHCAGDAAVERQRRSASLPCSKESFASARRSSMRSARAIS